MLLPTRRVERIDWAGSKVFVALTRDAVKNSPDYDPSAGDNENGEDARLYDASRNDGHWR